jgi:hypothetical protein
MVQWEKFISLTLSLSLLAGCAFVPTATVSRSKTATLGASALRASAHADHYQASTPTFPVQVDGSQAYLDPTIGATAAQSVEADLVHEATTSLASKGTDSTVGEWIALPIVDAAGNSKGWAYSQPWGGLGAAVYALGQFALHGFTGSTGAAPPVVLPVQPNLSPYVYDPMAGGPYGTLTFPAASPSGWALYKQMMLPRIVSFQISSYGSDSAAASHLADFSWSYSASMYQTEFLEVSSPRGSGPWQSFGIFPDEFFGYADYRYPGQALYSSFLSSGTVSHSAVLNGNVVHITVGTVDTLGNADVGAYGLVDNSRFYSVIQPVDNTVGANKSKALQNLPPGDGDLLSPPGTSPHVPTGSNFSTTPPAPGTPIRYAGLDGHLGAPTTGSPPPVPTPTPDPSPTPNLGLSEQYAAFSPNGDGVKDRDALAIAAGASQAWTLSIDGQGTLQAGVGNGTVNWDGKVNRTVLPDGMYVVRAHADGTMDQILQVAIDTKPPVILTNLFFSQKALGRPVTPGEPFYSIAISANIKDVGLAGIATDTVKVHFLDGTTSAESQQYDPNTNLLSYIFNITSVRHPGTLVVDITANDNAGNVADQSARYDLKTNQRIIGGGGGPGIFLAPLIALALKSESPIILATINSAEALVADATALFEDVGPALFVNSLRFCFGVQAILSDAVPLANTAKVAKSTLYAKTGGFNQAATDLQQLTVDLGKGIADITDEPVSFRGNLYIIKILRMPGIVTLTARPFSTKGSPTLEIRLLNQSVLGFLKGLGLTTYGTVKIRY